MNKRYWAFLGFPDFYGVCPCRRMAGSWLLFGARLSRVPKTGHKGFLIPHCRCLQSNPAPLWMIVPPFIIIIIIIIIIIVIIIITNTGSGGFHCAQTLDWTGSFASFFSASAQSSVHCPACTVCFYFEVLGIPWAAPWYWTQLYGFHSNNSLFLTFLLSQFNVQHHHHQQHQCSSSALLVDQIHWDSFNLILATIPFFCLLPSIAAKQAEFHEYRGGR